MGKDIERGFAIPITITKLYFNHSHENKRGNLQTNRRTLWSTVLPDLCESGEWYFTIHIVKYHSPSV